MLQAGATDDREAARSVGTAAVKLACGHGLGGGCGAAVAADDATASASAAAEFHGGGKGRRNRGGPSDEEKHELHEIRKLHELQEQGLQGQAYGHEMILEASLTQSASSSDSKRGALGRAPRASEMSPAASRAPSVSTASASSASASSTSGEATNNTYVTFAGPPACFRVTEEAESPARVRDSGSSPGLKGDQFESFENRKVYAARELTVSSNPQPTRGIGEHQEAERSQRCASSTGKALAQVKVGPRSRTQTGTDLRPDSSGSSNNDDTNHCNNFYEEPEEEEEEEEEEGHGKDSDSRGGGGGGGGGCNSVNINDKRCDDRNEQEDMVVAGLAEASLTEEVVAEMAGAETTSPTPHFLNVSDSLRLGHREPWGRIVVKVIDTTENTTEAVTMARNELKFFRRQVESDQSQTERNDVLAKGRSHVINMLFWETNGPEIQLGLELCLGGDLFSAMHVDLLCKHDVRLYAAEIASAIHFVHSLGFRHGDVKAENVALSASGHCKLIDFDLAQHLAPDQLSVSSSGSLFYAAPEVLCRTPHRMESDWWSFGVLVYEMAYGFMPFDHDDPQTLCDIICTEAFLHGTPSETATRDEVLDLESFIDALLDKDASTRLGSTYGLHELAAHPYLRGPAVDDQGNADSDAPCTQTRWSWHAFLHGNFAPHGFA